MLVYLCKNVVNGKVYIGQTVKPWAYRWAVHRNAAQRGNQSYFHRAIRKHGVEMFQMIPLAYPMTKKEMNLLEQHYIAVYQSQNPRYGYNMTLGGEEVVFTKETRQKMSDAHRGKPLSEKHRQNIIKALKGHPVSEDARRKSSEVQKGRVFSEETRRKMSEAQKGHTNARGKRSDETRQRISVAKKGKPLSAQHRSEISEALKRAYVEGRHKCSNYDSITRRFVSREAVYV